MNKYNIFFPNFSDEEIKEVEKEVTENNDLTPLNKEVTEAFDVLFPIDERTGNTSNDVTRLLSPVVSAMEKDRILQMMQKMPASKRHNLSDDELMSMLPSRYNTTFTDLDKVRDYFNNVIIPESDEHGSTDSPDTADTSSSSNNSTGDAV